MAEICSPIFEYNPNPNNSNFDLKNFERKNPNRYWFYIYPNNDNDVYGSLAHMYLPSPKYSTVMNIVGESHGIACLSDARRDVFLCNPNTGKFRQLPPSILLNKDSDPIALGFGYDAKSNDFKVVRVVTFRDPPHHYHPSRVEIYDLSTDRWREIKTPVPGYFVLDEVFEISYNGVFYGSALDKNYKSIFILFDMSDEVFHQIPAPDDFSMLFWSEKPFRRFGIWNGSIVLFICPWSGDEKPFDMWVMDKDESGAISWTKKFTIIPVSGTTNPIMFLNPDEILMSTTHEGMVSYNVNTKEFKSCPITYIGYLVFEKSLLSVEGGTRLDLGAAS